MLDTGNLYDLLTREDVPDWTSQTWEIDWENNRLLSRRIDGKEAVAQAATVALNVDYLKYPIFSDRFGHEFSQYIGGDRDLLKCNAERLIKECLSPDLRIKRVTDFKIEDLDKHTIHISFKLHCEDGIVDMTLEVDPNERQL